MDLNIIVDIQFGSHLYGTSTPQSDQDFRGVYLPTSDQILLGNYPEVVDLKTKYGTGKNTKDDVDRQYFSVKKFLFLLKIGDTGAYDMLFAPSQNIVQTSAIWDSIILQRSQLIHKSLDGMVGYVYHQAAKYGLKGSNIDALEKIIAVLEKFPPRDKSEIWWNEIVKQLSGIEQVSWVKLPLNDKQILEVPAFELLKRKFPATNHINTNLEVLYRIRKAYGARAEMARHNAGLDWKALYHAYRVLTQTEELLKTGHITFPRPDAERLLKIRKNEVPYAQLSEEIVDRIEKMKELQKSSSLPEKLDDKIVESLIKTFHRLSISSCLCPNSKLIL